MYGMMGIQRLLENVMFLAALCTAVAPAGHSYFPLVVLAGEGTIGTTTPLWILVTLSVRLMPYSAPAGVLSHSCDQGSGCLVRVALGRSDEASKDPISVGCQRLNVTALQGHFQLHCL